jgi:PAS domain S-box-containing protein
MNHAVPANPARAAVQRRSRREWGLLVGALLALFAYVVWSRYTAWQAVEAQERQRLEVQARVADENLARQLVGAYEALNSAREQVPVWRPRGLTVAASRELRALADAMPAVGIMTLLDTEGRVIAASRLDLLGRDLSDQPPFRAARERGDPSLLMLSPPSASPDPSAGLSMTLALVVPSTEGRFGGVVTATLDGEYIEQVLNSVLYAPDMWASVAHGAGRALLVQPPNEHVVGLDLARPGSMFTRHREAGQSATVMTGRVFATGAQGLLAHRTIRPASLPLDHALVVAVGRDVDAMFAPWREQTVISAALFLLFAAALSLGLVVAQRRALDAERLRAAQEAGRRESAERLELALRGGDLGLWDLDLRSGVATLNERWNAMLGRPHHPTEQGVWRTLVHPDDWQRVDAAQQDHLHGRSERYDAVYRLRHADGHWVWVHDRGQVIERDANGRALRMVGTHMDISERMQAQEALRRNEESLAITLESIGDAVIATDADGRITRLNRAGERLTGWTCDEALGRPLAEVFRIFDARTREPAGDPVQQVLARGEIVGLANGTLLVSRDGREHQIADSAAPIRDRQGTVVGVVLAFSDVTEHYRIQQALRDNEERLRSLLDNLAAGVIVHGADGRVLDANPVACRVTGLSLEALRGRASTDPHWVFLEEDGSPMPHARYPVVQVLASGRPLTDFIVGLRRPDLDRPLWVLCNVYPTRGPQGEVDQVIVTFVDVTERVAANEGLRLLGAAVERLNDIVMITEAEPVDEPGPRIVFVNAAFERLTGWKREEVIGRSPRMLNGPRTSAEGAEQLDAARRRREPLHCELVNYTREGTEYRVEIDLVPLTDRSGRITHMVSIERDVTERSTLERQVREAQKMESIGTLAGGIAHDFNNILAAILGNVALAREDAGTLHPVQASLDQINRAGLRARHLVQQILAFSRQEQRGLVAQPLRPVVEETLDLLRSTLPAGVRLDARVNERPATARVDATQLQQVLMNLCTNAWHAVPAQGGRIEVGLDALDADGSQRDGLPEVPPGPQAHLWVRDNGHGMDAATRERIFEPFFTTKPVGQGTGLGLPVVHGIVRSHGGHIAVDSVPGQGTTFHIYLPWVETQGAAASAVETPPPLPIGRGQHVLYIDDDEVLVLMVERLLQRSGFRVTTASDPHAALARLREQPRAFDAVVTDFNMPELSGLEVARAVAALRTDLPVVMTSGYLSEDVRHQATAAGVRGVVNKEHTLEELPGLLQSLLG